MGAINVEGADQMVAAFRAVGGELKDLTAANRKVAKVFSEAARARAASGTRQQSRARMALKPTATRKSAALSINNTSSVPFGKGAFLGAIRWKQFPAWVGNSWNLEAGDGPYVVAPAFVDARPEILDAYNREVASVFEAVGLAVSLG